MLRQSRSNWLSSPLSTKLLLSLIGSGQSSDRYIQISNKMKSIKGFDTKTKLFVSPEYKLKDVPRVDTENIDFRSHGAKENISKWVKTYGLQKFDFEKHITGATDYLLLNISSLKMPWHSVNGCGPLMIVYNTFSYTEDIKYEARILELPLQQELKLIILVPNEVEILYNLFNKLVNEGLLAAVSSIQPLFTSVSKLEAPKIDFQAENKLNLKQCESNITSGSQINFGQMKINEWGANVICLTSIHSAKTNTKAALTLETELSDVEDLRKIKPFLFVINYMDNPIFTGQLIVQN